MGTAEVGRVVPAAEIRGRAGCAFSLLRPSCDLPARIHTIAPHGHSSDLHFGSLNHREARASAPRVHEPERADPWVCVSDGTASFDHLRWPAGAALATFMF